LIHLGWWQTRDHDPPHPDDTYTPSIETEFTPSLHKKDGNCHHRLLDPIRDLVNGSILSAGHTAPLHLKLANFGPMTELCCLFAGSDNDRIAMMV
jgi:hypothetical protein